MNSGLGQLIKGVIIGVVLILAIIGSMSILDKNKDNQAVDQAASTSSSIPAPTINITRQTDSTAPSGKSDTKKPENTTTHNTPLDETATVTPVTQNNSFKPVLENEPDTTAADPQKPVPIQYGILKLNASDIDSKQALAANFEVFNSDKKKVAESLNTQNTSFRLPVGQYKIVATLVLPNNPRKTDPVISTQYASIRSNSTVQKTFKMEPPSTIGVLQVSAKDAKTHKIMRASYTIQNEDGTTIAKRQNVASTLFKLKAGSYKVTVKSGQQTDFRTVIIDPGESTKEVFNLQEANQQGRLLVRIFDTKTNKPVSGDILIATPHGDTIQKLTAVSKTELSLPQGDYTIKVTGPNGESSKKIRIVAGRANNEIFRFDVADEPVANEVQITENVKIVPPRPAVTESQNTTNANNEQPKTNLNTTGKLILFARNKENQSAVKSNFYVQTLSGKNIDKKIYADSATFDLKPGTYKVTVRSKNRVNNIKKIQVFAGKEMSETFLMKDNRETTTLKSQTRQQQQVSVNTNKERPVQTSINTRPEKQPTLIPNGFLTVAMQPPRNTHFIISNSQGKKIVELTRVPNGKFKLDTGSYKVTAILGTQRQTKTVRVREGKNTRISFNPNSFRRVRSRNNAIVTGILRSRIVNQAGQPIRGSLKVIDSKGRVIAQANNISVATFRLPPATHTLIVNAEGLRGSEQVKILEGETTVQTFTIVPPNQENTRSPREKLRDRLKQEIKRRF